MSKITRYEIHTGSINRPQWPTELKMAGDEKEMLLRVKQLVADGIPIHAVNEIVTVTTNIIEEVAHIKGWQLCYDFALPGSSSGARCMGHQTDLYDFRTGQGMLDTLCGVYGQGSHWLRPIVTEALSERCDVLDPQVNALPRKGFAKPYEQDDDIEVNDQRENRKRGEPLRTKPPILNAIIRGLGINDRTTTRQWFEDHGFAVAVRNPPHDVASSRKTLVIRVPEGLSRETMQEHTRKALRSGISLSGHLSFEIA